MVKFATVLMTAVLMVSVGSDAAFAQRGGGGGGGGGNHGGGSSNHGGGYHGGGNHGGGNWGGGNWGGGNWGGGWNNYWNNGWNNYNTGCYNNGYYNSGYYNNGFYPSRVSYTTSTPVVVSQPVRVVSSLPSTILSGTITTQRVSQADLIIDQLYPAANQLGLDMYYNYQHNAGWADTYRLTFALVQTTKAMQANDYRGDSVAVAQRLREMDQIVQDVRLSVRGWTRRDVRSFGNSGLSDKIDTVDNMVIDLMQQLGVRPLATTATRIEEAPAPPAP
ncbi:MAG: hypothetical protein R3C01_16590 [Planctomycetaceae bacterium]